MASRTRLENSASVRFTLLGSGDSFASGGRFHSNSLVTVGDTHLIVDCGPTALHALFAVGVDPSRVRCALITHFHGDHLLGLPMLILNHQYRGGPPDGLLAMGPPGVEQAALSLYGTIYAESARMLAAIHPPLVRWKAIRPGRAVDLPDGIGTVRAYPMNHNPESQAYRLEIAGRSVAFTGDTLWTDAILDLARGADLLVIDCTFREKALGSHLTYREIVEHRGEIEAERIVLTHFAELPPARSPVSGLVRGHDGLSLDL